MRLSSLLIASGLVLSAAACATAPSAPIETGSTPDAGPAPLADHDWFFHDSDGEGRLMYGAQDSDVIWVILTCDQGSGALKVLQPAVEPHPIRLESGGDTETYQAEALPDELHDLMLSAPAAVSDPVFQRFRRVGWMATWGEAGRVMMAAQPGSLPRITDFFAFCG